MMAYDNKFVLSVLVNGKPLREINENNQRVAKLPFGSEYTIRLKNRSSFRAKAKVFIDGTDVLFDKELVLNPHGTLDLERFLENNSEGKKFKFISLEEGAKSGEIQDPTSEENGKIEVQFFQEIPSIDFGLLRSSSLGRRDFCSPIPSDTTIGACTNNATDFTLMSNSSDGATVEGGLNDQVFKEVSDFATDRTPTNISILLKGTTKEVYKWGIFEPGSDKPLIESHDKKLLFPVLESMEKEVTIKKV